MSDSMAPEEAQAIAHEAYVYGFPMVENYNLMYPDAVVPGSAGFNVLMSMAYLAGPDDKEVVTPNNDTAYSRGWLDLCAEPMVLTTPVIEPERYWSFQFIDYFTNNFKYIGTRATGPATSVQRYVIAGPGWTRPGDLPADLTVIESSSLFIFLIGRTQVFDERDLDRVKEIQAGYELTPLSKYLGTVTPEPAPPIQFPEPKKDKEPSLSFFTYMNLALSFETIPASDQTLMERFARINVGPGLTFDPDAFGDQVRQAMDAGIKQAYADIVRNGNSIGMRVDGWQMPDVKMPYFGTTDADYAFRAAIAYKGIYANSPIEAVYPIANDDANNAPLTGARAYTITFPAGQLPPANYFWSLTMYDAQTQLLVENPISRYSISDRTDGVVAPPDAPLVFYLQHLSPGPEKESCWLPAPEGGFYVVLRVYGPKDVMLEGQYGGYRVPGITPAA